MAVVEKSLVLRSVDCAHTAFPSESQFSLDCFDDGRFPILPSDLCAQPLLAHYLYRVAGTGCVGGRDEHTNDFAPGEHPWLLFRRQSAPRFITLDDGGQVAEEGVAGRRP